MVHHDLHPNARTDAALRKAIRDSDQSIRALARTYGLNPKTVAKWKRRAGQDDLRSGPRRFVRKEECPPVPTTQTDRRAEALRIAGRIFLKYGYERAAMSTIAAELGGSKSTLWQMFPSKAALLAAYLETGVVLLNASLGEALDVSVPMEVALGAYVRRLLAHLYSPDTHQTYRLILGASPRFQELGMPPFRDGFAHHDATLVEYLEAQRARGHLGDLEPQDAAQLLQSLCNGGRFHRLLLGLERVEDLDMEREAERIIGILLRSFRPIAA